NSLTLKRLELRGISMTEGCFHDFLPKFSLLEHLVVELECPFGRMNMSNPLMKEIVLRHKTSLAEVEIDCSILEAFNYEGFKAHKLLPPILLSYPPRDSKACLHFQSIGSPMLAGSTI
ncbi:hypothetical protein CRG98_045964, partial [Punica granatum]